MREKFNVNADYFDTKEKKMLYIFNRIKGRA
jgi:hypothetical protein